MKKLSRIALLLTLIVAGAGTPALHARNRNNRPRVLKSIDVSNDPAVNAAEQRHKDAEKALNEAKEKRDKAAIDAAQKEHDETQKALSKTRNKAFAAAKKKQGYR